MPLYEYECDAQHHRFEVIQKFSDPPVTSCPTCGSPVHKLIAAPAFQLKGTGWYITDYAKKDSGGGATSSKSESKDSASSEKSGASEQSEKSESAPKPESTPAAASSEKKATSEKSS